MFHNYHLLSTSFKTKGIISYFKGVFIIKVQIICAILIKQYSYIKIKENILTLKRKKLSRLELDSLSFITEISTP